MNTYVVHLAARHLCFVLLVYMQKLSLRVFMVDVIALGDNPSSRQWIPF